MFFTRMKKLIKLLPRALGILRRNPSVARTLLRMEGRYRYGIPRDRRAGDGLSAPPASVSLNLTMRCNLKCVMCRQIRQYAEAPAGRPWFDPANELPLEKWIEFLDQLTPFRPWIYVTGGEPLISKNFREVVLAAKARKLPVQVQTNGVLLEKHAEFIVDAGVEAVTVSLDGPQEEHDAIRGVPGTFERMTRGARLLVETRKKMGRPNPILSFNCAISKHNASRLPEVVAMAIELGADAMQMQHTMFNSAEKNAAHNAVIAEGRKRGDIDTPPEALCDGENYESELDESFLPILDKGIRQAQALAKDKMIFSIIPNLRQDFLRPYYFDLDYPFLEKCDSFWQVFRVLPDGTVSPCMNFIVGNIRDTSVMDIWNGPRMRKLRELISKKLFPGCARCCHRHFTTANRAF
jgi:MoaA/NifB/PqqE/SkfB family radical SAM enzyme